MPATDHRDLLAAALSHGTLEHLSLSLSEEHLNMTRVANNEVTQHLGRHKVIVGAQAWDGQKVGQASGTDTSPEGLQDCVARAERAARLSPENPEALPPLDGAGVEPQRAWDDATAGLDAARRVALIAPAAKSAQKAGRTLAGTVSSGWHTDTLVTSTGARLFHQASQGGYSGTLTDPSGGSFRVALESTCDLPTANPARALGTLAESIAPGAAAEEAPGKHRALLSAEAVGSLLIWFLAAGDARGADESRNAFAANGFPRQDDGRLLGPGVSIWTDPAHQQLRTSPFDFEGHPLTTRVWVEDGHLKALPCTRYWATQSERPSTGSSWNLGLSVAGQAQSEEELLALVGDGLFIPRFWYIRSVDPMTMLLTGLTRDGMRRVEGGGLGPRLQNFRFNDSPLRVLGSVVAAGEPEMVSHWGVRMVVPPLVVEGFTTTSVAPGE